MGRSSLVLGLLMYVGAASIIDWMSLLVSFAPVVIFWTLWVTYHQCQWPREHPHTNRLLLLSVFIINAGFVVVHWIRTSTASVWTIGWWVVAQLGGIAIVVLLTESPRHVNSPKQQQQAIPDVAVSVLTTAIEDKPPVVTSFRKQEKATTTTETTNASPPPKPIPEFAPVESIVPINDTDYASITATTSRSNKKELGNPKPKATSNSTRQKRNGTRTNRRLRDP